MVFASKIVEATYDILRGINAKICRGTVKIVKIIKIGIIGSNVIIKTSDALNDFACQNYICDSLDIIETVSSSVGLLLGNILSTKHLRIVSRSFTIGCHSVRYYCKNYGTFSRCKVAAGHRRKKALKFSLKR